MSKLIDLTGMRFGRLTVISRHGATANKVATWLCRCDCGKEKIAQSDHLRSGATTSCGCYQKERASKSNKTHGNSRTRLYNEWQHMKKRCYSPSMKNYVFYGKRGIVVCDEWKKSFQNFKEWALKNGYADNLTLDRIDVDGNYEPSNCRWATKLEQSNNRAFTKLVTYHGETGVYEGMCRKLNVNTGTIRSRMKKKNVTFEDAVDLFPPTAPYKSYCGYKGP